MDPLADPALRLLVLIVIGRVDEVTAGIIEGVQELGCGGLVYRAHAAGPGLANGHGAQLQRRDAHTSCGREDTQTAELGWGGWLGHDVNVDIDVVVVVIGGGWWSAMGKRSDKHRTSGLVWLGWDKGGIRLERRVGDIIMAWTWNAGAGGKEIKL